MSQIFKKIVPHEILFELLEKIYLRKTDTYYFINTTSYKKAQHYNLIKPFCEVILPYYHISKQTYVTRDLTYAKFCTILRQIAKSNGISFVSKINYDKSKYEINYYFYYDQNSLNKN
jgi:hypothetical protein